MGLSGDGEPEKFITFYILLADFNIKLVSFIHAGFLGSRPSWILLSSAYGPLVV